MKNMKETKTKMRAQENDCCRPRQMNCANGCGGAMYVLGIIGSAVYFISKAAGFWSGVVGFLKALVWPVFLIHALLKFLGA